MPAPLPPVTLTGRHVVLAPLALDHVTDLADAAAADRSTYGLTWVPDGEEGAARYVDGLLADHAAGTVLPFAQIDVRTGRAVGCTRYLDIQYPAGRGLPDEIEIGGTWLGAAAQRTAINTEAKLLLLRHAFEVFGVWRVAICTDARNQRSRDAIERIGATFEAILRNHRLRADTDAPSPRHTAIYSILPDEWPAVEAALEARLAV